jgi:hypothetical protein
MLARAMRNLTLLLMCLVLTAAMVKIAHDLTASPPTVERQPAWWDLPGWLRQFWEAEAHEAELEIASAAAQRAGLAKLALAEDVLAGRLTVDEAAEQFRTIDATLPAACRPARHPRHKTDRAPYREEVLVQVRICLWGRQASPTVPPDLQPYLGESPPHIKYAP